MHESEYTRKYIMPRLEVLPDSWWLKVVGTPAQRNGVPDIVGCYLGRFIGIEIKNPDNDRRCTRLQVKNLTEIRSAGGLSIVARKSIEIHRRLEPVTGQLPDHSITNFPYFRGDFEEQNLEEL